MPRDLCKTHLLCHSRAGGNPEALKEMDSRFHGNNELPGFERNSKVSPQTGSPVPGFTLLEVLVALEIMAFAVVYLVQLSSSNLRLIAASGEQTDAATRAESKMREIISRDVLEEKSWQEETEQGHRVAVAVSEDLKERSENLPIKLLKIEMDFSWQQGLKEKTLTLRTLKMVNKIDNRATGD